MSSEWISSINTVFKIPSDRFHQNQLTIHLVNIVMQFIVLCILFWYDDNERIFIDVFLNFDWCETSLTANFIDMISSRVEPLSIYWWIWYTNWIFIYASNQFMLNTERYEFPEIEHERKLLEIGTTTMCDLVESIPNSLINSIEFWNKIMITVHQCCYHEEKFLSILLSAWLHESYSNRFALFLGLVVSLLVVDAMLQNLWQ